MRGFPAAFVPGSTYTLTVELAREGLAAGGFQLSVRRDSGPVGTSAGELLPTTGRVQVVTGEAGTVRYAQHTLEGSHPSGDGVVRWSLDWRAPRGCRPAVLHAAANAANGDDSEFGDRVYALRRHSRPRCPPR